MGAREAADSVDGLIFSKSKHKYNLKPSRQPSWSQDIVDGDPFAPSGGERDSDSSTEIADSATADAQWLQPQAYDFDTSRVRVLIICNIKFDPRTKQPLREAGQHDAGRLLLMCQKLNIPVTEENILIDPAHLQIQTAILALSKSDPSSTDAVMIFITSHGKEGGEIWARDYPYELSELTSLLSPRVAPNLSGKPKLFFVQACRGNRLDPGAMIPPVSPQEAIDSDGLPKIYESQIAPDAVIINSDQNSSPNSVCPGPGRAEYSQMPEWPDFLIAYSTVEGYYSWRNRFLGSWFIQDLTKIFTEQAHKHDLLSLITAVNRQGSVYRESSDIYNPRFHHQKQTTCLVQTLTKDLYFYPP